ncbi:histidine kinase dimerization/phospho-acceptor domain-containing protein [Microbacterium trichothecenolyticum]|uniref:histidine kinase n=1 Tax=Microbacterium trichothecenolyticum TaxID=69370 RepID=A0ABU0TP66_MICTR|nr:signal transduction histidine kinase [Microbacterium trichothecenolyticum]
MTVALLAIGLFTAGIGTMVFLRTTLVNNLDEQLAQQAASSIANSVFTTNTSDGQVVFSQVENAPQIGSMVVVYGPDGERKAVYNGTSSRTLPQLPATFTLEQTYLQIDRRIELEDPETGQHFLARVGVVQPQGNPGVYTQMVIQPLAPTDRIVAAYVGIYAFVALLILIASALLTRWLVTLTFRNLRQVETTAMDIAAGDFSQRLTDIVPDTEVGRLKTAINAMLARIDGALGQRDATVRQMRRFIGDASHELRTPLVTMRGYAELYRMGAIRSDEDVAQSMERIEKEAIRMGALVEDLLALARLDERRDVTITSLDLRPIARDAAMDLRVTSPQREVTVDDTTSRTEHVLPVITLDPLLDAGGQPASSSARRRTAPTTLGDGDRGSHVVAAAPSHEGYGRDAGGHGRRVRGTAAGAARCRAHADATGSGRARR